MDTNECRSSRGVHAPAQPGGLGDLLELLPHVPAVQRRSILTAEYEIVLLPHLPRREPFGGLAGAVGAERLDHRPGGQLQDTTALTGLGVTLDPNRAVHRHRSGLEVHLVPRDGTRLLSTDPGQQGQHHVGREPVGAGLDGIQEHGGLVQRHRLGRPPFLPFGHVDQARHVAADLVAGLGLADRALKDLMNQAERPRGQLLGALVQPVVELVGRP
jgi:hypothetical protein